MLALEDARARLADVVEQPIAEAEQRRSRRRDTDFSTNAQEELLVQFFLEQEDLPAHSGLGHAQMLACARKRTAGGNRLQNLELSKIHVLYTPWP